MQVSDIMTRSVVTISMDATLSEVHTVLEECGFHHLPVVEQGELVGVLSLSDVFRHTSPFVGKMAERSVDRAAWQKRVHQVMTRRVVLVQEDCDLVDAAKIMLRERVSCVPVVRTVKPVNHRDRMACVGIVTLRDLAGTLILMGSHGLELDEEQMGCCVVELEEPDVGDVSLFDAYGSEFEAA